MQGLYWAHDIVKRSIVGERGPQASLAERIAWGKGVPGGIWSSCPVGQMRKMEPGKRRTVELLNIVFLEKVTPKGENSLRKRKSGRMEKTSHRPINHHAQKNSSQPKKFEEKKSFFKHILSSLLSFLIGFILVLSLPLPVENKFDRAPKIYLVLLFACISLIFFIVSFFKNKKAIFQWLDFWKILSLGFYVLFVCNSFFQSKTANFGFTEIVMLLSIALVFATKRSFFRPKFFYILGILILSISGIAGFIFYLISHHNRVFGLFFNPAFKTDAWPNAFALFFIMLWPLFFHFFCKVTLVEGKKLVKIFLTLFLGFLFSTFILSFSRAGFLVLIGQIGILILWSIGSFWSKRKTSNMQIRKFENDLLSKEKNHLSKQKIFLISQIIGVVFCAFLFVMAGQYLRSYYFQKNTLDFNQKAQFAGGEEVTSIQERIDFMKGGIALMKQEPIYGFGPMSFGYVYRSIQKDWLAISDHPHNIFIKIGAENGVPALLFFTIFLVIIIGKLFQNFSQFDEERKFILVVLATSFFGALAHNLVDYNLNFITNFLIFWLLINFLDEYSSVSTSVKARKEPSFFHFLRSQPHYLLIMPALILALLVGLGSYITAISLLSRRGMVSETSASALRYNDLYPRYYWLEQADKTLEKLGQNGRKFAVESYLEHLQLNPWDSEVYNRLGEFYFEQGEFEKAIENFSKAIEIDPKNSWKFYKNYFITLEKLNKKEEIMEMSQKVLLEMKQYIPKVKGNLHFEAQHDNSKFAAEVSEILIRWDVNNRAIFEEYRNEIQKSRKKYTF